MEVFSTLTASMSIPCQYYCTIVWQDGKLSEEYIRFLFLQLHETTVTSKGLVKKKTKKKRHMDS